MDRQIKDVEDIAMLAGDTFNELLEDLVEQEEPISPNTYDYTYYIDDYVGCLLDDDEDEIIAYFKILVDNGGITLDEPLRDGVAERVKNDLRLIYEEQLEDVLENFFDKK